MHIKKIKKLLKSFFLDEEEKKMTPLDKFVIHNQKTPSKETIKAAAVNGQATPKEKPVSVADFFGDGSASRSSRTTAVAKRKHEQIDEVNFFFSL